MELKNCPFCNGKVIHTSIGSDHEFECQYCSAYVNWFDISEEYALELWNTRPQFSNNQIIISGV